MFGNIKGEQIHPRNPYKSPHLLIFEELAERYPELYPCLEPNRSWKRGEPVSRHLNSGGSQCYTLNFRKQDAWTTITEVTLKDHFKLNIDLPRDSYAPAIPARMEYILFLQDLIAVQDDVHRKLLALDERYPQRGSTSSDYPPEGKRRKLSEDTDRSPARETILALDIGTGPVLINSLLGCCADALGGKAPCPPPSQWHFVATSSDIGSEERLRKLLSSSDMLGSRELSSRIAIMQREDGHAPPAASSSSTPLVPPLKELESDEACGSLLRKSKRKDAAFDLVIGNPPYSTTEWELRCRGLTQEYAPMAHYRKIGGFNDEPPTHPEELLFLERMLEESIQRDRKLSAELGLDQKSTWYTCLIKHRDNMESFYAALQDRGVTNIVITTMEVSWSASWRQPLAVAWSLGRVRPQGAFWNEIGYMPKTFTKNGYERSQNGKLHVWKSPTVIYDCDDMEPVYDGYGHITHGKPPEYEELTSVSLPDAGNLEVVRATAAQHLEAVLRSLEGRGISWMRYEGESFNAKQTSASQEYCPWLLVVRGNSWNQRRRARASRGKGAEQEVDREPLSQSDSIQNDDSGQSLPPTPQKVKEGKDRKRKSKDQGDGHVGEKPKSEASFEDWSFVVELSLHAFQRNKSRPGEVIRLQARWLYGDDGQKNGFDNLCKSISTKLKKTPMIPPDAEM